MPGSRTNVTMRPRPDSASSKQTLQLAHLPLPADEHATGEAVQDVTLILGPRRRQGTYVDRGDVDGLQGGQDVGGGLGPPGGVLASRRIIRASRGLGHDGLCQVGATGAVLMC